MNVPGDGLKAVMEGTNHPSVQVKTSESARPVDDGYAYCTRVYGGDFDGEMHRYATWGEALAGHRETCDRVFGPGGGAR